MVSTPGCYKHAANAPSHGLSVVPPNFNALPAYPSVYITGGVEVLAVGSSFAREHSHLNGIGFLDEATLGHKFLISFSLPLASLLDPDCDTCGEVRDSGAKMKIGPGSRMADEAKLGKPWEDDELDAIVTDYFEMLTADLAGTPYVKSQHSKALMERIGRTHRSVEFKHQNISAVLDELGLPWIPGYIPKRNYQKAIFAAIDRYLTLHPAILQHVPVSSTKRHARADVFVESPSLEVPGKPIPEPLQLLVRKFDPVERDHRNRSLGRAGEEFVVDLERFRLTGVGRSDLARLVRWVSAEEGDGAGYDVLSFDQTGSVRLLEVKTTNGSARTPFFVTRNECEIAAKHSTNWRIYRVHQFAKQPRIFTIKPPLEQVLNLRAEIWRASF